MTTLAVPRPTRPSPAAPAAPIVFTGGLGPVHGTVLDTWTTTRADDVWACGVVERLAPGERAVVSLAFEPDGPAVAHRVGPLGPAPDRTAPAPLPAPARTHRVVPLPGERAYADQVRAALARIAHGPLEKVVLGRCLDVVSEPPLDPAVVVAGLLADPPGRHVFAVPLGPGPDAPLLLGASPELLVRRRGTDVRSTPLAGSTPRSADPVVDAERRDALLGSAKDRAEHAFVVDAIRAVLAPLCVELDVPRSPQLVRTDTLWHLGTPIRGRLAPDAPSALALARLLHPTPAVGGVPTADALAAVDELEGDLRGHLTGAVGWVDAAGDGELAVTIRAGVLHGAHLRLFAGAGIVAGSDPDAEVRETRAKLDTMVRAIGLDAGTGAAR